MRGIDITEFIQIQKFLKFDFLFGFTKKNEDGKVIKIPMKQAVNFTDPNTRICEHELVQKNMSDPANVPYQIVGVIMKKNEGLKIYDKKLICIDIDCKGDPVKGFALYEKVVNHLVENVKLDKEKIEELTEKTISGGYHIFLTSSNLYPQKKLFIENGIEIEIFSANRYIATAPSLGYTAYNKSSCVNFGDAYYQTIDNIALDHFCSFFDNKDENEEKTNFEINLEFIFDENNFMKITKGWTEYEKFITGKGNKDWDNIFEKGSTYDYIRHNLMPIFALFNKKDLFLSYIENYGEMYRNQWKDYPDRWLENFEKEIIILGKDARKRLAKAGFFQNKTKKKQDIIDEFVLQHMPNLFKNVMLIYDAIYYYNDEYKCYTYLEKNVFYETLGLYYKNNLNTVLKPEDYRSLQETFYIYTRIFCSDKKYKNYIQYDLIRDRSYQNNVPLVFKNGTLYIMKDRVVFKEGFFSPDDKVLFSFQANYSKGLFSLQKESIIMNWFKTKFSEKDLAFIQLFFGNLLIPSYNPSIMLVLYSYKGALGKSTLAKTLSSIFDIGSNSMITTLPLTRLGDRFGGGNLSRALLNITTELDGKIDSETFKNVISREKWGVENKFENVKFEIPIAKHISMANDVPKISADGGVTRRLAIFELSEQKAMQHIEAHKYEEMFFSDSYSLISFMVLGLIQLQKLNFADLSNYYRTNFKSNVDMVREYNSNVYEWLGVEGMFSIKEALLDERKQGLTENECYLLYTTWCTNNGCNPVKKRTMMKYLLSTENIARERKDNEIKITVKGE